MGVPVVTLNGDRFSARMSASVLKNMGLDELVARDREDYVAIAQALAQSPWRLAALRTSLRSRLLASPLCDAAEFTRELERIYRSLCPGLL